MSAALGTASGTSPAHGTEAVSTSDPERILAGAQGHEQMRGQIEDHRRTLIPIEKLPLCEAACGSVTCRVPAEKIWRIGDVLTTPKQPGDDACHAHDAKPLEGAKEQQCGQRGEEEPGHDQETQHE